MAGSESESESTSGFGPLTLAAPSPPGLHVRTLAADPEIPEARGPDSGGAGGTLPVDSEPRLDRDSEMADYWIYYGDGLRA